MTFKEHYQSLKDKARPLHPAKAFIQSIAEKTGRSPRTVQQWISGIQSPGKETASLISKELGEPVEALFPEL